jgi:uncharacterized membrane protein YeaQ/YmgE (transglycosylase-associated protein family)
MIASVIGWIIFGLIAGAIARMLHPGDDSMGWGMTIVLGIAGSLLGGAVAYLFHLGANPYEPAGWILSILGAVLLLALGAFGTRRRVGP